MIDNVLLNRKLRENRQLTEQFLLQLINISSPSAYEQEAMDFVEKAFSSLGCTVVPVPLFDDIREHLDACSIIDAKYQGRNNLSVILSGRKRKKVVINTHIDTVPPLEPRGTTQAVIKQGRIFGRGACDAKGQIATIYLAVITMLSMGIRPAWDVEVHIVVEEEVGGNGSLLMTRDRKKIERAIIMEPTSLCILTGARGAVWFRIKALGRAGHSAQTGHAVSALKRATKIMDCMEKLHADILQNSQGQDLFCGFDNPMPLTFGMLNSGSWPATVPHQALIQGVFGFLPNHTSKSIIKTIRGALNKGGFEGQYEIDFPFKRDCMITDRNTLAVKDMESAAKASGLSVKLSVLTACCDAWFYSQCGAQPVIFGPGSMAQAHSDNEYIEWDQLEKAARVLINYLTLLDERK